GCQPKPIVLRRPLAKTSKLLASAPARIMVAFNGLDSGQALQVLPTETYIIPSGPKAMVRFGCCPPSGNASVNKVGSPNVPSAFISAEKISLTATIYNL